MNLREQAEADLGVILEDSVTGFGYAITLTDPGGLSEPLTGFSNDIAQLIDPDTGQAVSGRLATAALRVSTLLSKGFTMPRGIADTTEKPWVIEFDDINGFSHKFKVAKSDPDRTLGLVICTLEVYK